MSPKEVDIHPRMLHSLVQTLENAYKTRHKAASDFKIEMTAEELTAQTSQRVVHHLQALFGDGDTKVKANKIVLRRVQASGLSIPLHKDHSLRTMQIPLNAEEVCLCEGV